MNRAFVLGGALVIMLVVSAAAYYEYTRTCCAPQPVQPPAPQASAPAAPAAATATPPSASVSTPPTAAATPAPSAAAAPQATPAAPAAGTTAAPPPAAPAASPPSAQPAPAAVVQPSPTGSAPVASAASPPAPSSAAAPAAGPSAAVVGKPPVAPSFDIVRIAPTGEAVIAGRAEPGAAVAVLDRDQTIASVTADQNGEWVLTLEKPLAPGNHELALAAKSPGQADEQKSSGVVVVAVPERKTAQTGSTATGEQPLAVLMPREGQGAAKALQLPGAAAQGAAPAAGVSGGSRALVIEIVQYDGAGHLGVSGHAPANGRVLLYLDNAPIAEANADAKGDWSGKSNDPVTVGDHDLRGDLVGADGKVQRRVLLHFKRLEVPATLADNQFLVVQPGNSLWRIARHVYGQGPMFTEIYRANRSEIVNPDIIYPGQVVAVPPG